MRRIQSLTIESNLHGRQQEGSGDHWRFQPHWPIMRVANDSIGVARLRHGSQTSRRRRIRRRGRSGCSARHHGCCRPSLQSGQPHSRFKSQLNGRGLDGLANVAGIGLVRPLEYAPLPDMEQIFEINVFGQIAVTQAFLPLLRQNRGRVVNVTSVGAHIAIPFGGLLNASKGAFAMLSDTLRLELHPFGIRVCAVEPGAIATPADEKTLANAEQVIVNLPPEGRRQYASIFRGFAQRAYAREKSGSSPDVAATAVHHALTSSRPRIRYRVGEHAKLLATLAAVLPDRLLDAVRFRLVGLPVPFGTVPLTDPPEGSAALP
jgi:NAD(P)-dependent dehydrogenase (short-subunit alcohol dehydrogenase family)